MPKKVVSCQELVRVSMVFTYYIKLFHAGTDRQQYFNFSFPSSRRDNYHLFLYPQLQHELALPHSETLFFIVWLRLLVRSESMHYHKVLRESIFFHDYLLCRLILYGTQEWMRSLLLLPSNNKITHEKNRPNFLNYFYEKERIKNGNKISRQLASIFFLYFFTVGLFNRK